MKLLPPRPSASWGAFFAVFLGVTLILAWVASDTTLGYGPLGDVLVAIARATVLAALLWAVGLGGLRLAQAVGKRARTGLVVATVALGAGGVYAAGTLIPSPALRLMTLLAIGWIAWLGAAFGAVLRDRSSGRQAYPRALIRLGVPMVMGATMVGWLFLGTKLNLTPPDLAGATPRPASLEVANPGLPGVWPVASFTYGSGHDRRRPEYADSVFFTTPSLNLAPLLPGFSAADAQAHRRHWGFGLEAIPLNARVWLPAVDGTQRPSEPFPLVVLVPGIDPHSERSELGYAYLAELLASRGFVVVGIDVNFLGGPRIASRAAEMPVRAWLALEHLQLLREWQEADPTGIPALFDLDRIGLVGHSRGGEAAALAAMLNQLERYPDNASIPLAFGFGIRAVVALAPTDGSFRPTGRPTTLTDVSYLVLHGSQDGDLVSFVGMNQYRRVHFSGAEHVDRFGRPLPPPFRASVYLEGANHANFSSARSGFDHPGMIALLVNRKRVVAPMEQQRLTSVFTAGFLEATLRGEHRLRALFRDPRTAGDWLPDVGMVTLVDESETLVLADFDSDSDPSSGTLPGVTVQGINLTLWREEGLLGQGRGTSPLEASAVRLSWNRIQPDRPDPAFEIRLPEGSVSHLPLDDGYLVFALGSASRERPLPDLSVELEAKDGTRTRLPLGSLGAVPKPIESRLWRIGLLDRLENGGGEPLLQTFDVPLARFKDDVPAFDLDSLSVIRFVFDRAPFGTVLLDNVGLRGGRGIDPP